MLQSKKIKQERLERSQECVEKDVKIHELEVEMSQKEYQRAEEREQENKMLLDKGAKIIELEEVKSLLTSEIDRLTQKTGEQNKLICELRTENSALISKVGYCLYLNTGLDEDKVKVFVEDWQDWAEIDAAMFWSIVGGVVQMDGFVIESPRGKADARLPIPGSDW
jgi:hypothetical protein